MTKITDMDKEVTDRQTLKIKTKICMVMAVRSDGEDFGLRPSTANSRQNPMLGSHSISILYEHLHIV